MSECEDPDRELRQPTIRKDNINSMKKLFFKFMAVSQHCVRNY